MKTLLLVALSILLLSACGSLCKVKQPGLTQLLITCDSVSIDNQPFKYEPTFFRFTNKSYLLHTYERNDFSFKILESKQYTPKPESDSVKLEAPVRSLQVLRVFSLCNEKEYLVYITDLKKNGVIQFDHPERSVRFHILSVTNDATAMPKESNWIWWR